MILETSEAKNSDDELDESTPEDEQKREVFGAEGELKSREPVASLLSLIQKTECQSGTGDMTFSCIGC